MTRRTVTLLVAVLAVVAACSGDDGDRALGRSSPSTTTTTTAAPADDATTSTTAAPVTTTTTAVPLPEAVDTGEVRALITPTEVVVPVTGRNASGYQVMTPCGRTAVVADGTPITRAHVVLDPGHGGEEEGAVGPNGVTEREINDAVAAHTKRALEQAGATVVLTRLHNYRITLEARALIATRLAPLAFVSIHHNGGADQPLDKPGTETFYQVANPHSKRLAGLLYEEVVAAFSRYEGVEWWGERDAGAKYRTNDRGGDYYGILRRSAGVTAALSEGLFLSASASEAALLARPDVQQAEGEAIARAVVRLLTTSDPGSGFVEPYPRTEPAGPGGGAQGCSDPQLS